MGIIVETESAVDKDGALPDKVWKETHNDFKGADPTFEQVIAAESIDAPTSHEVLTARSSKELEEHLSDAQVSRTRTSHSRQER